MSNKSKKIHRRQSEIFTLGVILTIFFSTIIGYFNGLIFYVFGLPILGLLVGLILIWFAQEKTKLKILFTFLSPLIILYSFAAFYFTQPKAEPETFLIPKNLRGKQVAVVFEKSCGQSINYEDGRRIYKIPENGILIIKNKLTMGKRDRQFYLSKWTELFYQCSVRKVNLVFCS